MDPRYQQQQQPWMMQPPQQQVPPLPQQFQQPPPQMYTYNPQPQPPVVVPQYTVAGGPTHQPASADEVRTLWIGDLQYWMDEQYLVSCFAQSGEVYFFSLFAVLFRVFCLSLYVS